VIIFLKINRLRPVFFAPPLSHRLFFKDKDKSFFIMKDTKYMRHIPEARPWNSAGTRDLVRLAGGDFKVLGNSPGIGIPVVADLGINPLKTVKIAHD
jgi:hypothetical protein